MKEKYAFVMMIKDKWWNEFLRLHRNGKLVQSYVQGGWAPPKNTSTLLFYVTKPVSEMAGYADFVERKVGNAEEMWKEHGRESVLGSAERYFDFIKGKERISFIRFENLQEAATPLPLNNLLTVLGIKRLARGGFYIDKNTADKLVAIMK
jgi:predicted transcriptional regulator